jgi:hypothetical protein
MGKAEAAYTAECGLSPDGHGRALKEPNISLTSRLTDNYYYAQETSTFHIHSRMRITPYTRLTSKKQVSRQTLQKATEGVEGKIYFIPDFSPKTTKTCMFWKKRTQLKVFFFGQPAQ